MTAVNRPAGDLPQHYVPTRRARPRAASEVERAIVTRCTVAGYGTEALACLVALDEPTAESGAFADVPYGTFPDGL